MASFGFQKRKSWHCCLYYNDVGRFFFSKDSHCTRRCSSSRRRIDCSILTRPALENCRHVVDVPILFLAPEFFFTFWHLNPIYLEEEEVLRRLLPTKDDLRTTFLGIWLARYNISRNWGINFTKNWFPLNNLSNMCFPFHIPKYHKRGLTLGFSSHSSWPGTWPTDCCRYGVSSIGISMHAVWSLSNRREYPATEKLREPYSEAVLWALLGKCVCVINGFLDCTLPRRGNQHRQQQQHAHHRLMRWSIGDVGSLLFSLWQVRRNSGTWKEKQV